MDFDVTAFLESPNPLESAFFTLPLAPEYLTGPMLLATLYRMLGFKGAVRRDSDYSYLGSVLKQDLLAGQFSVTPFTPEQTVALFESVLATPQEEAKGKYSKHLFLYPLVPWMTLLSQPVRLSARIKDPQKDGGGTGGNAWRVDKLLANLMRESIPEREIGDIAWHNVFTALSITSAEIDPPEDSIALMMDKALENYFSALPSDVYGGNFNWVYTSIYDDLATAPRISREDVEGFGANPLLVFRENVESLLSLKSDLTRLQWLSMIEAYLRIAVPAYVAWLMRIQVCVQQNIAFALSHSGELSASQIYESSLLKEGSSKALFTYGTTFSRGLGELVLTHQKTILWLRLFDAEAHEAMGLKMDWNSVNSIVNSTNTVLRTLRARGKEDAFRNTLVAKYEMICTDASVDSKILNRKSTVARHMSEFFGVMRQANPVAPELISPDQSYWVRRRNTTVANSQWIVKPGALSLLTLVQCCAMSSRVGVTQSSFVEYLLNFGITIPAPEKKHFHEQLRNLGLTLDSPDAEEGVIIVPPFQVEGGKR